MAEPKVFSVTVKRVMGEYESRDELREYATLEAKRQALEQAGAYLETQTIVQNSRLVKDDITALAAAVLSTKQANEKWEMEGGHFVIWLTYEIKIESDDLERRIKDLIQERQKIEDYKQLQAENARLEKEIADLYAQMEKSGADKRDELKEERKKLSEEYTAQEWFYKGLKETDLDLGIEYYANAIRLMPDFAEAYNNRGAAYNNKGEYDRAIADLNKAISLNPNFVSPFVNRGNAYEKKGNYDQAIIDYNRALLLCPEDAELFVNRGLAYRGKGDYESAFNDYNKAIALDPELAEAYNNRGIAYIYRNEYDTAISDFTKALSLKPQNASYYNHRGSAYSLKEEWENAIEDNMRHY
jgi:tetratricopeptide (TPR) repeat protein